ncbi:VPS15 protein kinase Ppk19 [Schizosaccharomyces cryophilus OY26]|uniref:non-specific serine/threonine protein kinase n=1 Tax=Schizosaccharomyces cryophilus (strain OY26 / ATCC MYA-4695 / CBS 11777 / NBRC 106824 / NRRL Y48691) TaxID=653667 RepID=S9VTR6_SCHCR|nr:VPS15 protein kinase Ppk19 [Schizosaccharomyces cryophilus OY26]EPY49455.1 VPS15 protein kinase Ppk19 [Schizosaccharomyces cryophilus OY26]
MGIQLSTIQTPQFHELFSEELPEYYNERSLGDSQFLRTFRMLKRKGNEELIKVFVNKLPEISLTGIVNSLQEEQERILEKSPNVLPYTKTLVTLRAAYLMRPYVAHNLYDRISTRPFLDSAEKKWIMFQLLKGISDCHKRGICHGDIKTENVLVTTWNWVYISDFSSFKPTYLPEDNPADYSYFFDTSSRRVCNIAPERFVPNSQIHVAPLTPEMDIFSLGCVFAELLLEGSPLFTLSQLFNYKANGSYDIAAVLRQIKDQDTQNMILQMLQCDPTQRDTADYYLKRYRGTVFPECFYVPLYNYCCKLLDPQTLSHIQPVRNQPNIYSSRVDSIFNDLSPFDDFFSTVSNDTLLSKKMNNDFESSFMPLYTSLPDEFEMTFASGKWYQLFLENLRKKFSLDGSMHSENIREHTRNNESYDNEFSEASIYAASILLPIVLSALRHVSTRESKLNALRTIEILSTSIPDEAKLDTVLPFVMTLVADEFTDVRIRALITITRLVRNITAIAPINAFLFQEYLFPDLQRYLSDPNCRCRATYASCLPELARQASKFVNLAQSLRNAGILSFPESEYENVNHGKAELLFETGRHDLVVTVERHVSMLLADGSSIVRRSLLSALPPLCVFFGKAKSNDLILSHLITYLNDTDWMLRCAFFESITGLAIFIGSRSVDEYILPLMLQALVDPEPAVLESVLESFAALIELQLFDKLVILKVLHLILPFSIIPNIYTRKATLSVVYSTYLCLEEVDRQCILMPVLLPYLLSPVHNINSLEELDLFIVPMVPASVWSTLTHWFTESDNSSEFWRVVRSPNQSNNDDDIGDLQLSSEKTNDGMYSFSNLRPRKKLFILGHTVLTSSEVLELNDDDRKWIDIIKNLGIKEEHLFILGNLREYVFRTITNSGILIRKRESELAFNQTKDTPKSPLHILPEMIFWNPEAPYSPYLLTENMESNANKYADSIYTKHSQTEDLVSPESAAYVGTDMTNAFGSTTKSLKERVNDKTHYQKPKSSEANTLSEAILQRSKPIDQRRRIDSNASSLLSSDNESSTQLLENQKEHSYDEQRSRDHSVERELIGKNKKLGDYSLIIDSKVSNLEAPSPTMSAASNTLRGLVTNELSLKEGAKKSSYTGNNPYVTNYLNKIYAEAAVTAVDFGPAVAPSWASSISLRKRGKITNLSKQPNKGIQGNEWQPEGVRVTQVNLGNVKEGGIKRIIASPDSLFFVTLGLDGLIRAWQLVENDHQIPVCKCECRLVYGHTRRNGERSRFPVVNGCFMGNTYSFASVTQDGSIEVHRLDVNNQKHKLLTSSRLPNMDISDSITSVESANFYDGSVRIVIVTAWSKLYYLEAGNLQILASVQLPVDRGSATSVAVSDGCLWVLIGTSKGWLLLWDLRFNVLSTAWRISAKVDKIVFLTGRFKKDPAFSLFGEGNNNQNLESQSSMGLGGSSSDSSKSIKPTTPIMGAVNQDAKAISTVLGCTTVSISFSRMIGNRKEKRGHIGFEDNSLEGLNHLSSGVLIFDVERGKCEEMFLENWELGIPPPIPIRQEVDDANDLKLRQESWPRDPFSTLNDSSQEESQIYHSGWPCLSVPVYYQKDSTIAPTERKLLFVVVSPGSPHAYTWDTSNPSKSSSITNITETAKISTLQNAPPVHLRTVESSQVRPKSSGVSRPLLFLQQLKYLPNENRIYPIIDIAFLYRPYALTLLVDAAGNVELWT